MQLRHFFAGLALSASVVVLSSCENTGTIAGGGADSNYSVARQALENGNYNVAIRGYQNLLGRMSPGTASRIELEYAHSLLRANRFDEAIEVANRLTQQPDNSIRASALAVRGTAQHEAARKMIASGQHNIRVRQLLEGAQADLAAFLHVHSSLDAGGAMRARSQIIASDLLPVD